MAPPPAADNFGQRQRITTAIKNICLYYPPNTCLRELLQNADDAGATEIEYVLDTLTYGNEPLLSNGLKAFQGPALLARNNSVFRNEDFDSLSSVGDSVKKQDPAATGKFGQGFNAVYHWTDGPWIYSRQWLLILDPHEWWSGETGMSGGPRWDVVQNVDSIEIQNHLETFRQFGLNPRQPLNQTIIRIPFRTAAQAGESKLFQQEITIQEIRQALEEFGQEIKEGGLLFLKHIRKVTIRVDSNVVVKAEILETNRKDTETREQLPIYFKGLYASTPTKVTGDLFPICEVAIRYTEGATSKVYRYVVQHAMLKSSGDQEMDAWAREKKLFPWVAVAAPLKDSTDDQAVHGRLFTTLRLPMPTNLPVHIHGLFSIAPDRGRLSFMRGSNDPDTMWNKFIFTRCVALAWVKLLAYRNNVSWDMEMFDFWPRANSSPVEMWDSLDDNVIDMAINFNQVVWNASDRRCVDINQGFFAIKDAEATKYVPALAKVQIPGVYLEETLFQKVQERAKHLSKELRILEPKTVRHFLRSKEHSLLTKEVAPLVLEFCLLDALKSQLEDRSELYNDLQGLRLWPTVDGGLSTSGSSDLLLPRNDAEKRLFAKSRASTTLDISKFSPAVGKLVQKDINNLPVVMRFRGLGDLAIDWPSIYPIIIARDHCGDWVTRPSDQDIILHNIWAWIFERIQEGQRIVPALFGKLWLLPGNDYQIRRYGPTPRSFPVLIIEKDDPLFQFLVEGVVHTPGTTPPFLDVGLLPTGAVGMLRNNKELRVDTKCTSVEQPDTFVDWLVAGISMLSTASDPDNKSLLSHLETLTKESKFQGGLSSTLMAQMCRLPIFSKIVCLPPFKERGHMRCSLDTNERLYKTPSGLPHLPNIPKVSFFDPQSSGEKSLVKRLKVLEDASVKDLLTRHFLPWMDSMLSNTDTALISAKEGLVDWLMEEAPHPRSEAWQSDVFNHPIIPLPVQSGQRRYRCIVGMVDPSSKVAKLYDEHENLFPCAEFHSRHKKALITYGILSKPLWSTALERARYFSNCGDKIDEGKVQSLLNFPVLPGLSKSAACISEIRVLKWLPGKSINGESVLLAPSECRGADESHLVDLVWGTTAFAVETSWRKILGWNECIGTDVLLQQLDGCLSFSTKDQQKINKVLLQIDPEYCSLLLSKSCILSRSGDYLTPDKVFLPGKSLETRPLAPYLDIIDGNFIKEHQKLLTALRIRAEPSIEDLQDVQRRLVETSRGQLTPSDLGIAISTLEIATLLHYDPGNLLVPDTASRLRNLEDIVHGESLSTGDTLGCNFTHPQVSPDLARRIGIEGALARAIRLEIDLDSDDEVDFTPGESLQTNILDALERYQIGATFNEFLANADDAGATKIIWTLDACGNGPHCSSSLLTSELKPFQGPALLVYNDGLFTKKNFAGIKNIGQGSKQEDAISTGMFGRGVLSMYHFTDVPMLVSDDTFLILDPQQRVLPFDYTGRRKRRVGLKLLLSSVDNHTPDQLSPFIGLHGFDPSVDKYNGTIFRLPLRGTNSTLGHTPVDQARVGALLEEYFATARTALLFLRNVNSIEFHIRGQESPQWAVSLKRWPCEDSQTFQRVEITTVRNGSDQHVDTWCVGLKGFDNIPTGIIRSGRGMRKVTECGIAACLKEGKKSKSELANKNFLLDRVTTTAPGLVSQPSIRQKVFCRLPTSHESLLPVSFHASFAVTGDRRSIALEDSAENSAWNQWLLKECVAALYLETIQFLAPRQGRRSFNFWPTEGQSDSPDTLSGTLSKAFWNKLASQHDSSSLLPLMAQKLPLAREHHADLSQISQSTTNLSAAKLDFLPKRTSEMLRPLLVQTCPLLVRPPMRLWLHFHSGHVNLHTSELDPDHLGKTFKVESNCVLLEAFITRIDQEEEKRLAIASLLGIMIPKVWDNDMAALRILDGCRVVPRPQIEYPLGTLIWKPQPEAVWNLVATAEEQELFSFAADSMVNTRLCEESTSILPPYGPGTLRDPIKILLEASFNVRRLGLSDVGILLARANSPTAPSINFHDLDGWISKFWRYLDPKLREIYHPGPTFFYETTVEALLSSCGLHDHPVYRIRSNHHWRYITPRQFDAQPCIVMPLDEQHQRICEQIPGLLIVDRNCIPFVLREKEGDLTEAVSFERLLQALEKLEKTPNTTAKALIGDSLTHEAKDALQGLALQYLKSIYDLSNTNLPVLRKLPIWPRLKPSNSPPCDHIAAEDADFCGFRPMLQPWIKNLPRFVDPYLVLSHEEDFRKLGFPPLQHEEVWHLIKGDIPKTVSSKEARHQYREFLIYLAQWKIRPSGKIAPNGGSILVETTTLYDHQDEMFSAAFREEKTARFIHVDLQNEALRAFWLSIGLRARPSTRVMSHEYYLDCALAINRRNSTLTIPFFQEDSQKISAYLRHDRDEFRFWPPATWKKIAKIVMFCVRDVSADESPYRRMRMHQIAQKKTHCALEDAGKISCMRIAWSQARFLKDPPGDFAYQILPRKGLPDTAQVYDHLQFLMAIIEDVSQEDVPEYLRDVQACYEHLQEDVATTQLIHGIRQAPIWLNLDTTQVALVSKDSLEAHITSADHLCLNSPVDPLPVMRARRFLVPYEKLLIDLGCKTVVQPASAALPSSSDSRELSLASAMAEMRSLRDQDQLVDVILEVGGERKPAHKIVLAAVSDYCKKQFAGEWGRLLDHQAIVHLEGLSFLTLSQMVDFAYSGDFEWPELKDPGDNEEIAKNLGMLMDLLDGTDMWFLNRLHEMTDNFLASQPYSAIYVRADTVEWVKERAESSRAFRLVKHCEDFLEENLEFVIALRDNRPTE